MSKLKSEAQIGRAVRYLKIVGIGRSERNIKRSKKLFNLTDAEILEVKSIIKTEGIIE